MSAIEIFNQVVSRLSAELKSMGFERSGRWFCGLSEDKSAFYAINLRKIPQSASKRVVFQIVSFAGPSAQSSIKVTNLKVALERSTFQHRIYNGNVEKFWTVWPSSDPVEMARAVTVDILEKSIPALRNFSNERFAIRDN